MSHSLTLLQSSSFYHQSHHHAGKLMSLPQRLCLSYHIITAFRRCGHQAFLSCCFASMRYYHSQFRVMCWQVQDSTEKFHAQTEEENLESGESSVLLPVQTLRNFPMEKLNGAVVMVRFDSALLLEALDLNSLAVNRALSTIRHLYNAGAKILLISNWGQSRDAVLLPTQSLADYLSSLLQVKVVPAVSDIMQSKTKELEKANILLLDNLTKCREELANCSDFSEKLSSGVDIFVNDAFSLSHKILASTVGVTRFCCASIAGFHFEEELFQLTKARETTRQPYIAIIGGSNFFDKKKALHHLASKCDGLVFVGMLAFQIMHALGLSVPLRYVEHGVAEEAIKLIQLARYRNIPILFPNDFLCVNSCDPELLDIFPADGIISGWEAIDLGPVSLKEIYSLLSKCKKVLWIGPVKFGSLQQVMPGASELGLILERISGAGCDVFVAGNAACKAVAQTSSSLSVYKSFENAAVVWEFLKGRVLPGVAALDRAYPFNLDWDSIFADPTQPLIVDLGSGNGLFLLKMARRWKGSNFLGLEINKKLVRRCLDNVLQSNIKNGYFIATNATSTFRSIISSYPGDLVFVSIQCPNPDFNKEEHRWRMVQRTLVEAIIDLLTTNGQVFLQSDIKSVATRIKEQFILYGKGKLGLDGDDENGWIKENPFGVRSDWEEHVIARGAPMYRIMIRKINDH